VSAAAAVAWLPGSQRSCSQPAQQGPVVMLTVGSTISGVFFLEPINIYHGDYKMDRSFPIRISYHRNVHYNSLVDPYKATVGVGLGLPGLQPGVRGCFDELCA